jgi:site-specific DNA-methyltransferase (adenine-specific)
MGAIPDNSIDMVLCDLPYGTTQNKWDAVIPFHSLWQQYNRISQGPVVLTAAQPFSSLVVVSNLSSFKYEWIWRKSRVTGFLNAKRQPLRQHEQILVFYNSPAIYNPQGISDYQKEVRNSVPGFNYGQLKQTTTGTHIRTHTGYPRSVLDFSSENKPIHPTQKPVDLMAYMIRTYTNPGQTVLDNTMGSGTTGVAAVRGGRKFVGIERDPNYFKIACDRIRQAYADGCPGPLFKDAAE